MSMLTELRIAQKANKKRVRKARNMCRSLNAGIEKGSGEFTLIKKMLSLR
jgi:hypothetical protein